MATIPAAGDAAKPELPAHGRGKLVYRHRLPTRLWHWLNAATLVILFMSGLMIFNAHGRLYWGKYGANTDHAWLTIGPTPAGGRVTIGALSIPTTGVLGRWKDKAGNVQTRAFPYWLTIPSRYSLAGARRWHLSFAWVLMAASVAYLLWGLATRHLWRDVVPARAELRPANVWHDIREHVRLRFPTGEAAARYNILQKLAYAAVLFVLLPGIILTGLTMSPWLDANMPWLLALFGGRQSARSFHFLCAWGLFAFTMIHLAMVVLAGPLNELRSIFTGWFRLPAGRRPG